MQTANRLIKSLGFGVIILVIKGIPSVVVAKDTIQALSSPLPTPPPRAGPAVTGTPLVGGGGHILILGNLLDTISALTLMWEARRLVA